MSLPSYHELKEVARPCPGGQDWWIVCPTAGCGYEVHYGSYPYAATIKTYEIAHNLQRLMNHG